MRATKRHKMRKKERGQLDQPKADLSFVPLVPFGGCFFLFSVSLCLCGRCES